jgi:replicative DNA helicase
MTQEKKPEIQLYDLEAEKATIGAILIDSKAIHAISDITIEMFFAEEHRTIWTAVVEMAKKGIAIDMITITQRLLALKMITQAGGPAYISSCVNFMPSSANIRFYADVIKTKYKIRTAIKTLDAIKTHIDDPEPLPLIQADLAALLNKLSGDDIKRQFTLRELMDNTLKEIEEQASGQIKGISSGYRELDDVMGNYGEGHLVIVAGRPSMGKTAFIMQSAFRISKENPVLIFSLEMTDTQLGKRQLAAESGVRGNRINRATLEPDEWQKIVDSASRLYDQHMFIDTTPAISITELTMRIRANHAKHKIKAVFIDYLTHIYNPAFRNNRVVEVGTIVKTLRETAKDLKIPIILVSQLSREVEKRPLNQRRPQLADLRDSGEIEQQASVVLFMYRDHVYNPQSPENEAEIVIAKNQNGPTGKACFIFEKAYTRFLGISEVGPNKQITAF